MLLSRPLPPIKVAVRPVWTILFPFYQHSHSNFTLSDKHRFEEAGRSAGLLFTEVEGLSGVFCKSWVSERGQPATDDARLPAVVIARFY